MRIPTRELLNANERERVVCSPVLFGAWQGPRAEYEVEILPNREVRPQRQILKDESEVA